ncbi:MAG: D-alanyl-D-alanine carboxypeptidase/D-alanyl-D-alanine-endopeptidase [Nitrospinaceae bacterium]
MNCRLPVLKQGFAFFTFLAFLSFPSAAFPHEGDDEVVQFQNVVEGILSHPCLKRKNFGIKIFSLNRQETLYEFKNDKLFTPASNLKLITTAAAVKNLGPGYRFHTRLFSAGSLEGDTLHGDLYIKGYGDPKLVSEQMWLLTRKLRNLPLRKIEGDIIADDTYFDNLMRVKTWKKNPGSQAYNAPLGALSFNFNTVTVHVMPGEKVGDQPVVIVDPDIDYIQVDNRAKTVRQGKRGRLIVNRVDRETFNEITVSGTIALGRPRAKYFLNITDPTRYTATVFKQFLEQAGIEVGGTVKTGVVPEGAEMLASHESEPLSLALQGLNKFSNNFVAEQILKAMAAERYGPPGTTEGGVRIIDEYMAGLGYAPGQYRIVDGSGLSRQNRLSPDQIVGVLSRMRSDLGVYPEFITALGVMGLDGNVKDRMNGTDKAQKVRVKTGTLNFVSALSGYFQSMDGEMFAFSILMNDLKCGNGRALKIQDRIVLEGLHFSRGKPNIKGDDGQAAAGP